MDYRHSFKPICRLFGGRHIEITETEPKPINIWNYPGIENGAAPTKRQLAMVLTDILILSRTQRADAKRLWPSEISADTRPLSRHLKELSLEGW
jgi:hypothetical protein